MCCGPAPCLSQSSCSRAPRGTAPVTSQRHPHSCHQRVVVAACTGQEVTAPTKASPLNRAARPVAGGPSSWPLCLARVLRTQHVILCVCVCVCVCMEGCWSTEGGRQQSGGGGQSNQQFSAKQRAGALLCAPLGYVHQSLQHCSLFYGASPCLLAKPPWNCHSLKESDVRSEGLEHSQKNELGATMLYALLAFTPTWATATSLLSWIGQTDLLSP
jgi:hypothetical protein